MDERTVLITGASRGIGAATARRAAAAGWNVIVNYRHDAAAAEDVVGKAAALGVRAEAVRADVTKASDVSTLFRAVDDFGGFRALVNNAGATGGIAPVADVTEAQVLEAFSTNVFATINCTTAALRRLRDQPGGGTIINVTSTAARTGGAGEWVHYASSKAAVNCFTLGAAREAIGHGVRIAAVAPGLTLTDLHADNGVPDRPARLAPTVPAGRLARPDEIAAGIVWALSDEASYMVGSVLELGGGR